MTQTEIVVLCIGLGSELSLVVKSFAEDLGLIFKGVSSADSALAAKIPTKAVGIVIFDGASDCRRSIRFLLKNFERSLLLLLKDRDQAVFPQVEEESRIYSILQKPVTPEELIYTLKEALKFASTLSFWDPAEAARQNDKFSYDNIIGVSEPMQGIYEMIDKVASHDVTVLINGESGTGKELVASCIHFHSFRRERPFIKLNCAALPETLLESELFGHEKGSFTGAIAMKKGKFELADGGTIFLDEIGDMSVATQVKILRVLQEREFERIGGIKTIGVNVRIITATHRLLPDEIAQGRFREDLYYRLNVVSLTLPPLRDRKEDIILLAAHFLEKYNIRFDKEFSDFTRSAIDVLMSHDWPGNVRELENVIARAVVLGKGGGRIDSSDLQVAPVTSRKSRGNFCDDTMTLSEARGDFEKEFIVRRLGSCGWNVSKAARTLDLERSNLYRKMRKYGIDKGGGM